MPGFAHLLRLFSISRINKRLARVIPTQIIINLHHTNVFFGRTNSLSFHTCVCFLRNRNRWWLVKSNGHNTMDVNVVHRLIGRKKLESSSLLIKSSKNLVDRLKQDEIKEENNNKKWDKNWSQHFVALSIVLRRQNAFVLIFTPFWVGARFDFDVVCLWFCSTSRNDREPNRAHSKFEYKL